MSSFSKQISEFNSKKWKLRPEILLCANTVKPLHCLVPRVILGKEWWDNTRKEAYASTNYHCIACGVHKNEAKEKKWLEGHEVYRINYPKGRATYLETVPLCHFCHNYIHDGRLSALLGEKRITTGFYKRILNHGNYILKKAGIKKRKPYTGKMAEWGDWRLVLFGVEYEPIFKSYEEWKKNFSKTDEE